MHTRKPFRRRDRIFQIDFGNVQMRFSNENKTSGFIKTILFLLISSLFYNGCVNDAIPQNPDGYGDIAPLNSPDRPFDHPFAPGIGEPDLSAGKNPAETSKPDWRVILLALDGLEWRVLNDLTAAGRLPNFKQLIDGGASGVLKTDFADSPVTWTTIATGVLCQKHGICPGGMGSSFEFNLEHVKYPRLWEVLDNYSLKSCVANFYFKSGEIHSCNSYALPDSEQTREDLNPALLSVLKKFNRIHTPLFFHGVQEIPYKDLSGQMHEAYEWLSTLQKNSGDLFISHFQSPDEVGHYEFGFYQMWLDNMKSSGATAKRIEMGREITAAVYGELDSHIGEVRAQFPEALIVICSDHGMRALDSVIFYFIPQPELYSLMGLPADLSPGKNWPVQGMNAEVRQDEQGHIAETDENITVEFTPLQFTFSGPDAERAAKRSYDAVADIRINDMQVFKLKSKTRFGASNELIKNWQKIPFLSGEMFLFGFQTGTHRFGDDGVIILNGPGVKKGVKLEGAGVQDVAPTIYAYINVPLAEDLDGKPLAEAFTKKALPGLKMKPVATYGQAPYYMPNVPAKTLTIEEKNRLRALGYIQ